MNLAWNGLSGSGAAAGARRAAPLLSTQGTDGPGPPVAYPPPTPAYGRPLPPPQAVNALAVAGLAVGVVGLVTSWVPFVGVGLPVLAVALGAAGLGTAGRTGRGRGQGVAAVVLGAVGVVVCIAVTAVFLVLWPRVSPCLVSRLGPDAQARCLRGQLGLTDPRRAGPGPGRLAAGCGQADGPRVSTLARSTTCWT